MEALNIFTTNATRELAELVVSKINQHRNDDEVLSQVEETTLGNCSIEYFANKEITCQYHKSIRDKKVYIFGSTGTYDIMEFLLMIDAAKRASAKKIVAVIPCYGYARQDKKEGIRGPLGAKLVADMLIIAGAHSVVTIDLHADAIQGFFPCPVDHIHGFSIFKDTVKDIIGSDWMNYLICSPDAGGVARAGRFARKFGLELVVINKFRDKPGSIGKMSMVGEVNNKHIILLDDLIDSGGTLCKAANFLVEEKGAASVVAICTHPVFSGNAFNNIFQTDNLKTLYVSDTISFNEKLMNYFDNLTHAEAGLAIHSNKIKTVTSSNILAKIIGRVTIGASMDEVNK